MKRVIIKHQNFDEIKDFNWSCFAIDTETTDLKQDRLELTGISLCDGYINAYIPIHSDWNGGVFTIQDLEELIPSDAKIIMHNSSFDLRVLAKFGLDLFGHKLFDTMVAAHLLDENRSKSLKSLTRELLGREVNDYDHNISHYSQEFFDYALADSNNTYALYDLFLPTILEDKKLARLFFQIEMPFQKVIAMMEMNGVDIDLDKYKVMKDELYQEVLRLKTLMCKELKEPYNLQMDLYGRVTDVQSNINFNSPQQIINIFSRLGLEITETTDSGNPSVGKITIQKHIKHPFVELLYKYKVASKLYNAFVEPLSGHLQSDGKVRPSFNDVGARTGRLSCSNPNLQQLPNNSDGYNPVDFRSLFIAPQGYKMIAVDYSGQEIAVAAQVSRDPNLIESLCNGYDMHLAIANQFYNLNIPKEALSKDHPQHDEYKERYYDERRKAKTITFGLMYGKGAFGFSKDFGISEEEAQEIVDKYFQGMPMLKASIDTTHEELKLNGFVRNLAGRYRRFQPNEQGFYPNAAYRQAFNFKIQGFSADMIRAAMVNTWYRSKLVPHMDIRPIMTVHDEAVYIVKEVYAEQAAMLIKKSFEDVCKKFVVPVGASVDIGLSYAEAK